MKTEYMHCALGLNHPLIAWKGAAPGYNQAYVIQVKSPGDGPAIFPGNLYRIWQGYRTEEDPTVFQWMESYVSVNNVNVIGYKFPAVPLLSEDGTRLVGFEV